ncbi:MULTISPECIES: CGNR zinc finger domain-containing protein [Nocardioides]|uniref:CGNR zinc finger domain-containing protein n=1 Tax=Nocardioides vastitatis TaxID=2568655 RepID=A0ABW0ZFI2_9ACTN|nr:CGNR zinc finger domain-containing protein [Nocardioides sp.]THJ08326.1 CGNR zinc finger domain-containing protein [Nocardioides sp.]
MPVDARTSAPLLGEPLAVEFMNTIWADRDGIHDALATPSEMQGWLQVGPQLPAIPDEDLRDWIATAPPREVEDTAARLRELRNAVRRLAAVQTADPRERAASATKDVDQALEVVNAAAASAPHWSHMTWRRNNAPDREVHTQAALGSTIPAVIAEQVIDLLTSDVRDGLRACLAPGCVLYFVRQHPRREWCSTACGNRARAARHYARHRTDPAT